MPAEQNDHTEIQPTPQTADTTAPGVGTPAQTAQPQDAQQQDARMAEQVDSPQGAPLVETPQQPVDGPAARLAQVLTEREQQLIDLWWQLGGQGPTLGNSLAGSEADARQRYLLPLARTLQGALRGSDDHRAIYLDERLRYGSRDEVLAVLDAEYAKVAELAGGDADEVRATLAELDAPLRDETPAVRKVLFLGDCLFVEVRAFLKPEMDRRGQGVDVEQVFFSAQTGAEGHESAALEAVRRTKPDLIGISLFTFEGIPLYTAALRDAAKPFARTDSELASGLVELVAKEVAELRQATDATIVVHAPCGLPLDPVRRRLPDPAPALSRGQKRFLAELRRGLAELVEGTTNTILMDEVPLVQAAGTSLRKAGQSLFSADDVPVGYAHTTGLGRILAGRYADIASAHALLGKTKALFVDFDNTLWQGVMGEGAVVHHVEHQRLLKRLKEAGVLLVALSKNDASAIRWDEMELSPDDFVLQKINWLPKPDNAAQAISELDLGANAFVLLDDNPVERALVSEQVKGVQALDPTDPHTWELLELWFELPSTKQTEESARRTEMYREAAERRASLSGGHDLGQMMRSLKLHSTVRPATEADTERLLELVQRTNQFNTTTRRRSAAEVSELLHDENFGVRVATLGDRFGELGVVGVTIYDRSERSFDSFIMSCRAMGFGLESTMLRATLDQEQASGAVTGLFIPTERNNPAASLYRDNGFTETEPGTWLLEDASQGPQTPDWMELGTR